MQRPRLSGVCEYRSFGIPPALFYFFNKVNREYLASYDRQTCTSRLDARRYRVPFDKMSANRVCGCGLDKGRATLMFSGPQLCNPQDPDSQDRWLRNLPEDNTAPKKYCYWHRPLEAIRSIPEATQHSQDLRKVGHARDNENSARIVLLRSHRRREGGGGVFVS
ncbi:hypothetical protein LY78DRAFT_221711 [Colletotrichum sublineola]|nr:hypothetical protein LY78DRAFT_221711 [Colletotrichum sublineola]